LSLKMFWSKFKNIYSTQSLSSYSSFNRTDPWKIQYFHGPVE
jgi:hypothetical protein